MSAERVVTPDRRLNDIEAVLARMVQIGGRAKALHDAGFRYATIRFINQGKGLIPTVGALHYDGDLHQDSTAPFQASVYSIGDTHAGMDLKGSPKAGNSSLVTEDGAIFSSGTINASTGTEYTPSFTQVRAYIVPSELNMQEQGKHVDSLDFDAAKASMYEYLFLDFSQGELHNFGRWSPQVVDAIVTIFDAVLSAIEDAHKHGQEQPLKHLLNAPGEVESTATVSDAKPSRRKPKFRFIRLKRTT